MLSGQVNCARLMRALKTVFKLAQSVKRQFSENAAASTTVFQESRHLDDSSHDKCEETKLVKVAIIGAPNAGKSSLINQLTGRMLCPVSKKVHTTRCRARAVSIQDTTQIIFLDTPGLVTATEMQRFNLEESFLQDSELALMEADLLGVIHDVSNRWTSGSLDAKVLRLLELYPEKSSFLVLNKVDLLKNKRKLLELVNVLTDQNLRKETRNPKKTEQLSEAKVKDIVKEKSGWGNFSEVFIVSALSGDGVDKIMDHILMAAKPGKWLYAPSHMSDVSPNKLIARTVKAKLLEYFPQEVPYNLKTTVEYLDDSNSDLITAVVGVYCPTARIQKLVIGTKGRKIQMVAREAEVDLRNAFHRSVHLKIAVSSPKK
ncbi:GTPase Era, mitochondrial-like [Schistocerca gregaria]|uniref:GTPase Era, mitochondrial-like n=1 Tax=Schistocerca gregaria TaxID=7010 RepID=UPI00211DD114|nr:GTPase Era, mitochondrial-like [Schistocerca gregaria]